jgi:LPXTG-motif cell wall-anchored protein
MKIILILGALNAFLSVALGAFGAHGLEGKIPDKYLEIWQTGVHYQMFHSLGLFAVAFVMDKLPQAGMATWAGWLMFIGILLFSGSLYVLSLTQIKVLGAITPLGGVSFLIAWILLMVSVIKYL